MADAIVLEVERLVESHPMIAARSVEEVAARMVAAIPTHDFDAYGPFYDTPGLTRWLGISRQALDSRAQSGSLLVCHTSDGHRVYPAWQFRADGSTIPGLRQVLKTLLPVAASPWTVAGWLRTASPDLDDHDAASWLDSGGDLDRVLATARSDAARWAQ